jgi:hypothetical protein
LVHHGWMPLMQRALAAARSENFPTRRPATRTTLSWHPAEPRLSAQHPSAERRRWLAPSPSPARARAGLAAFIRSHCSPPAAHRRSPPTTIMAARARSARAQRIARACAVHRSLRDSVSQREGACSFTLFSLHFAASSSPPPPLRRTSSPSVGADLAARAQAALVQTAPADVQPPPLLYLITFPLPLTSIQRGLPNTSLATPPMPYTSVLRPRRRSPQPPYLAAVVVSTACTRERVSVHLTAASALALGGSA